MGEATRGAQHKRSKSSKVGASPSGGRWERRELKVTNDKGKYVIDVDPKLAAKGKKTKSVVHQLIDLTGHMMMRAFP
jgi:hypothetical protein